MFGLTKREQRWKAERRASEALAALVAAAFRAEADVRVAEAQTDATELTRLRVENERLRAEIAALTTVAPARGYGKVASCGCTACLAAPTAARIPSAANPNEQRVSDGE